jgi:membrane protease YdiL (CAAX protease family)
MPEGTLSILYSTIILCLFIIVIDLTKNIFKKIYMKDKEDLKKTRDFCDRFFIDEFKFIFFATFTFIILLIATLGQMGQFIEFNVMDQFYNNFEFIKMIKGSLFILLLNGVLYLGLIVQLIKGYEDLNIKNKNWILLVKENIYGPIIEEMLYRGIIFNILKSHGFSNIYSSLISSFMFGVCK